MPALFFTPPCVTQSSSFFYTFFFISFLLSSAFATFSSSFLVGLVPDVEVGFDIVDTCSTSVLVSSVVVSFLFTNVLHLYIVYLCWPVHVMAIGLKVLLWFGQDESPPIRARQMRDLDLAGPRLRAELALPERPRQPAQPTLPPLHPTLPPSYSSIDLTSISVDVPHTTPPPPYRFPSQLSVDQLR